MTIEFEDYSIRVKNAIEKAAIAFLHEAAGEVVSQTQRNTPVDTGQLKGSWRYDVIPYKYEARMGSGLQNAIWNEFGTGQYALHGDGRKTPWKYEDRHGKWHTTIGKRPQRSFHNAIEAKKGQIKKMAQKKFKGIK